MNLRGFFDVSRRAVAAMLARGGGGHVVNISTSLIDHANAQVPSGLASLTKGGLNAVTRSLAIEYADRGIRVNAVALGIIRTPMHPAETHEFLAALHPLGRMGEIERRRRRRSSTWRTRRSSPVRSCTSTAAKAPGTNYAAARRANPSARAARGGNREATARVKSGQGEPQ